MLHNLYYTFLKMLYCLPPYILHKVGGGDESKVDKNYS